MNTNFPGLCCLLIQPEFPEWTLNLHQIAGFQFPELWRKCSILDFFDQHLQIFVVCPTVNGVFPALMMAMDPKGNVPACLEGNRAFGNFSENVSLVKFRYL